MYFLMPSAKNPVETSNASTDKLQARHTMEITLYRSRLCPRCYMAGKYLREIIEEDPSLSITEIETTTRPITTWRQGIHMIPAIRIGEQTLSGVYLTKKQIQKFIQNSKSITQPKV